MKVTVAKAMKMKNRLAALLKEKGENIKENNSILKKGVRKLDVRREVEERSKVAESLVDLKTALNKSNMSVQRDVFELSELKAELKMWDEVPCDDGLNFGTPSQFSKKEHFFSMGEPKEIEMSSELKFADIKEIREKLVKRIDKIQDKLDHFNHTTQIEIPDACGDWV